MSAAASLEMTGRTVLISGASSGIGRAMAIAFGAAGARLVLLDLDDSGLSSLCTQLENSACAGTIPHALDLGDKAAVDRFWAELPPTLSIDTLINNAGIYPMRRFMDVDQDYLDHVMQVNLESLFWMCQGLIGHRGKSGGVIINVSSIEAFTAFKGEMVPYIASKSGVIGFSRALAREYGRKGFRVNTLVPGGIRTPGTTSIAKTVITKGNFGLVKTGWDFMQRLPLGRYGLPEEVANVALFLASDLASYIHGAAIPVDGGFLGA